MFNEDFTNFYMLISTLAALFFNIVYGLLIMDPTSVLTLLDQI